MRRARFRCRPSSRRVWCEGAGWVEWGGWEELVAQGVAGSVGARGGAAWRSTRPPRANSTPLTLPPPRQGLLTNRVTFKVMGLIPREAAQAGELTITGPDTCAVGGRREKVERNGRGRVGRWAGTPSLHAKVSITPPPPLRIKCVHVVATNILYV